MIKKDNTLNIQNFPKCVYIPFGDSEEYNKLVLDYNIVSNKGFWKHEFYDDTLRSEIPITISRITYSDDYNVNYMGYDYVGKLVNNTIITDILDINLKNALKYELVINYEESDYPIDEIVSFVYDFFNWENVNVQYEIDEYNNKLYLYIGTNVRRIEYDEKAEDFWCVWDGILSLKSLCFRTAQLSQYYGEFLKELDWFYVCLNTIPHTYDIAFYNEDHTKLNISDKFRVTESLRSYLYRNKKSGYSDKVKEYYYNLHEWIGLAIEMGRELNYPKEYFTDLRNATNELISPEFRQFVADSSDDSEKKERILSLGIYDNTEFDLGLSNMDITGTKIIVEPLSVGVDDLDNGIAKINSNKKDNKEIDEDESNINSNNIIEKVKGSMKNMSTLINRM